MKRWSRPLFFATAAVFAAAVPVRADWVLDWNALALTATKDNGDASVEVSRSLAMLHTAIYDAVNGISGEYTSFYVNTPAPTGADEYAAVAAAANTIMGALYPALGSSFTTLYDDELATRADSQAKTDGINWGNQVATAILNWRQNDGASNAGATPYTPSGQLGRWAPTPNSDPSLDYQNPPTLAGWTNVTPFAMSQGSQFRPAAPNDITSVNYANDYNEVFQYGSKFGSLRTTDQTEQAFYWADLPGKYTQVAHWNQIATQLLGSTSLRTEARIMAAMNVAMADAGITAWDAKFAYDTWRPISAIAYGDFDGNPGTTGDFFAGIPGGWESLVDANPTPEYLSEIGTFSSAAGAILKHYLGDVGFSASGDSDGNGSYDTVRNFGSISSAVDEATFAGIYGGNIFRNSGALGASAGNNIAILTANSYFQPVAPVPEPSGLLMIALTTGYLARRRRTSKASANA